MKKTVSFSLVAGLALAAWGCGAPSPAIDAAALRQASPPANGVWLDQLDTAGLPIRRPFRVRRSGQPDTLPPPPPLHVVLDSVTYPHGLPIASYRVDNDIDVDLHGQAVRFAAMVGIDDVGYGRRFEGTERGSVDFALWVDGKKVADSGILHRGDAPKLLTADLTGAKQLILATVDGGDGFGGDNADWGGAVVVMKAGATAKPVIAEIPRGPEPEIASIHTDSTEINYPRITGATPGRPFLFRIPAAGPAPLHFAVDTLPEGLTLDPATGIITGSLAEAGRFPVHVTVSGPGGTASALFTIVGGLHELALTPPMGWNSWNVWAGSVDQKKVQTAADELVSKGLAAQGYTYVNIDDTWEAKRDRRGFIQSNAKFPDMRALGDSIHAQGLKFGIYSSPGPETCAGFTGSWQHEAQDVATWSKWGVDYLKYDWCSYSEIEPHATTWAALQKPYLKMARLLAQAPRDIVFSLCQYGWGDVWKWGAEVGGNLWRVTGDISDNWTSMAGIGFAQAGHTKYAGPGHWNDDDMLVVGKLGWGPNIHETHLTPDEQMVHISLWSLQAAPLLIGADLAQMDSFTVNLLGNREVLAVDQDALGEAAKRIAWSPWWEVWARPLADGTWAVGLFNRAPVPQAVTVSWRELGMSGPQPVRDLWTHKDAGTFNDEFTAAVPRYGVVLVRVGTPTQ